MTRHRSHCCNLYLPQSLTVAFSGPHLRQQDRHKDTQGGGYEKERKVHGRRQGQEKRKKAGSWGEREADRKKTLKTRQTVALNVQTHLEQAHTQFLRIWKFKSAPADSLPRGSQPSGREVSQEIFGLKTER